MLNRYRCMCLAGVLFVVTNAFVCPAHATGRATKEQMAQRAKEAEKLWADPSTNYHAICSYLIKPGAVSRDDLINRLTSMLAETSRDQDKAALNYLMAETYYWGGLVELKKTRSKSAVLDVADNVARSFLAAWDAIGRTAPSPAATNLRNTITVRFNQLLGTSVCGGNLCTNLRQEVVARYIDRLDAADKAPSVWAPVQRGKVYANLGIQTRMAAEVPSATPTNFFGLCDVMNLAWCAAATNDALRFASSLEKTYLSDLAKWPQKHREVFAIYRACGDKRALPCIQAITKNDPTAWLELYDFSIHMDPRTSAEQRRKYMDSYFAGVEAKKGKSMEAYRAALDKLVARGDYELAIQLADRAFNDMSMASVRMSEQDAYVWRLKAIAHEKRGEKEKAGEAYRKGLDLAPLIEGEEVKELLRNGLKRVSNQEEDKGVK